MTCGVRVPHGFPGLMLFLLMSHGRANCLWLFVFLYCRCVFMDHRHRQRVATTTAKNRDVSQAVFLPLWQGPWPSKLHE